SLRWIMRELGITPTSPIFQAYEQDGVMFAWSVFSMTWSMVLSVILLIGGIMSLSLKPLGRKLLMACAWCGIATALPRMLMTTLYLHPRVQQWEVQHKVKVVLTTSASNMITIVVMLVGLCVNGYFLYALTRPEVKSAFAGGDQAATAVGVQE